MCMEARHVRVWMCVKVRHVRVWCMCTCVCMCRKRMREITGGWKWNFLRSFPFTPNKHTDKLLHSRKRKYKKNGFIIIHTCLVLLNWKSWEFYLFFSGERKRKGFLGCSIEYKNLDNTESFLWTVMLNYNTCDRNNILQRLAWTFKNYYENYNWI